MPLVIAIEPKTKNRLHASLPGSFTFYARARTTL